MNKDISNPPSREEARAALADVEQVAVETRAAIAAGHVGPELVLWGSLWLGAGALRQFDPAMNGYTGLIIWGGGISGSWLLHKTRQQPLKQKADWRGPLFWIALMAFAFLWMTLLVPWDLLPKHLSAQDQETLNRQISAFWQTTPMFAFIVIGLWVRRFFIWLGLIVTALIVGANYFLPDYFFLASGLAAGGSLILSAIFIRKFWK